MKKEITKRGVLYVGFLCNLQCKFCYYRYMKNKKWRDIDKLKKRASRIRYFYRNGFVDITGGEPTIYPHIFELVKYCQTIGLKPTIITNGIALADKSICERFKQNGINDFLVSIYGLGETADYITGAKNVAEKQRRALENLRELNISFRINVTVHRFTAPQLPGIAEFAAAEGAKVINMIIFNPFLEWKKIINIDFQEKYSIMAPYIKEAVKISEKKGIEINVRYLPFCQLKGLEKNIYNFKQLNYDPHEWDLNTADDHKKINPKDFWYEKEASQRTSIENRLYQKSEKCERCSLSEICDGFHAQYVKKFGFGEEKPYTLSQKIKDPIYFIQSQVKTKDAYQKPNKTIFKYLLLEDKELLSDLIKSIKCLKFIDRKIGQLGLSLKKHWTKLYSILKKIK